MDGTYWGGFVPLTRGGCLSLVIMGETAHNFLPLCSPPPSPLQSDKCVPSPVSLSLLSLSSLSLSLLSLARFLPIGILAERLNISCQSRGRSYSSDSCPLFLFSTPPTTTQPLEWRGGTLEVCGGKQHNFPEMERGAGEGVILMNLYSSLPRILT